MGGDTTSLCTSARASTWPKPAHSRAAKLVRTVNWNMSKRVASFAVGEIVYEQMQGYRSRTAKGEGRGQEMMDGANKAGRPMIL
jgi:hypothetical protein